MLSDLLLPSSTFKDSCDYVGSTWIIQDDISISTWPAKPFRSYKVTCSWVPEVILLTSLGAMGGRWQWDRNRLGRLDAGPHSQLEPGHPHSHQAYLLRFKLKLGKFGNYFQRYKIMESLCCIAPSASSHSSWKWPKGGLASCSICMGLGEQTVALEGKRWAVQLSRVMNTWPSNELWITQWPCRPSVHMLSTMVSHEMYHFTSAGAQMCGDHYRWPYLFLSVGQWAEVYASEAFREMGAGSWNVNLIPSDFPLGRSLAWLGLVCQSPSKSQGNYYL